MIRKKTFERFVIAMREINREVSDIRLQGRKHYYNLHDARWIWGKYNGRCADCGTVLIPFGNANNSVRFTHRVPLKAGGRPNRENLMPVCSNCQETRLRVHVLPQLRVVDYNTFADLIVHLVSAVVMQDEPRIVFFKRVLDLTLAQFVQELHAIPIGLDENIAAEPIEGESTVSEYVKDIAVKLARIFEEIGYSKQYRVIRRDAS